MHRKALNPSKLRKGAWGSDEDIFLRKCIEKYGEGKWHLVPHRAGIYIRLGHTSTSCSSFSRIILTN